MTEESKGNQSIGKKTFLSSIIILLLLMVVSGILTRVIPTGSYERLVVDGKTIVAPKSFHYTNIPTLPIWRWFTAPVEVLFGGDGLVVLVIIIFILITGGSINILNQSNVLSYVIDKVVKKYEKKKYRLLAIIVFAFMILGSVVGIFEEVMLLVPTIIPLAYILGWDSLVGLGMSLLAMGFGFSSAITNPFTVVVAQRLSDVPILSGLWLRVIVFIAIYLTLIVYLIKYAKKIEKNPKLSPVYEVDKEAKSKVKVYSAHSNYSNKKLNGAVKWFISVMILMLIIVISSSFIESLSDFTFPIIGLLFLIAGVGSGFIAGNRGKDVLKYLIKGSMGVAPGIILILMASAVKHIISKGGVMDTIIYGTSIRISGLSPYLAIIVIYFLVMVLNFFIGSATAKAFVLMPILTPLVDILGINRQAMVLAFQLGDGFSNVIYPTNPVLLISLGFSVVSYPRWFKWSIKIQMLTMAISIGFLMFAILVGYGPNT